MTSRAKKLSNPHLSSNSLYILIYLYITYLILKNLSSNCIDKMPAENSPSI